MVTYRYLPKQGNVDDFNRQLVETIQQDRRIFISSTRIDGKLVLRTAVLCFRTHLDDVSEALDVLKHTAEKLEAAWQQNGPERIKSHFIIVPHMG